jgi:hypothetical protein
MSPEFRPDGVYGTLEERLEEDTAELLLREQLLGVSFRDGLRKKRRATQHRPSRVVTFQRIVETYHELRAESDERVSQADIARRLKEDTRNVERTLQDYPGAWKGLTRR